MEAITTALTTAFTSAAGSCTDIIGTTLTLAMPVVIGMLVVKFGIKNFKAVIGK